MIQLRAERSFEMNGFRIHCYERVDAEHIAVVSNPLVLEVVPFPSRDTTLLSIHEEQAQVLMDDLWRAGVRPTDFQDPGGEVAAQRAHITDLQRVLDAYIEMKAGVR